MHEVEFDHILSIQLRRSDRMIDSAIVYSAGPADVKSVVIDGELVMRDRELLTLPEAQVIEDAEREATLLQDRALGTAR